jgi:hypothetical protein
MIGTEEEAERHANDCRVNNDYRCDLQQLGPELSDAIRAEWERQRSERVVGFIQLARLKDRTRW